MEEARYADKHSTCTIRSDISVDDWFDVWLNSISGSLASNTIENYRLRYVHVTDDSLRNAVDQFESFSDLDI